MIKFNEVTWYSRLAAIILFLIILPTLGFYVGKQYQQIKSEFNIDITNQTLVLPCYNACMKGYVTNIEKVSLENNNFRKVLYTDKNSQLVLMSLLSGEEIGEEIHDVDQFLRVEQGTGKAILNSISHDISDGIIILVPAGTKHNIINTGSNSMKLYTLYMPPHHRDGVIHKTKAEAESDTTDEFNGKTTE